MSQPATTPTRPATPKGAWTAAVMLLLYMLVNFADKIVVGLAGVPIMTELKLTPEEFGRLGSAFFLLFSAAAIVVGFIINRVRTRYVILALATLWALVQLPMIGTVSYTTLLVCRVILGAGEGPAGSVALHAVYKWFPDHRRALPTALLAQGSAFGVVLAVPALNWLIVNYTWHHAFGALGIVGLLWALGWLLIGREGPLDGPAMAAPSGAARVPYLRLLTAPTFIGCCVTTFGAYWALSLGLTWFTPFVVQGLGIPQSEAGWISILPWLTGAVVVLTTGWTSERLMARGVATRQARGVLGAVPLVIGGIIILTVPWLPGTAPRIAALVAGSGLSGTIYVVCGPMIGEFVPAAQRGAMIAIYGAFFSLAGIVAPAVMGQVVQRAGSMLDGYMTGFTINGVVLILAGLAGLVLLRPDGERARLDHALRRQGAIAPAPT
ncbi:MAG: MFS transporter [Xanthobacteraceae bacterium]|nr:MFS transporter [Xanthobacteraceae bacterium]